MYPFLFGHQQKNNSRPKGLLLFLAGVEGYSASAIFRPQRVVPEIFALLETPQSATPNAALRLFRRTPRVLILTTKKQQPIQKDELLLWQG